MEDDQPEQAGLNLHCLQCNTKTPLYGALKLGCSRCSQKGQESEVSSAQDHRLSPLIDTTADLWKVRLIYQAKDASLNCEKCGGNCDVDIMLWRCTDVSGKTHIYCIHCRPTLEEQWAE